MAASDVCTMGRSIVVSYCVVGICGSFIITCAFAFSICSSSILPARSVFLHHIVWWALKSPARMLGLGADRMSVNAVSPLTRYTLCNKVGLLLIHTLTVNISVPSLVAIVGAALDGMLFRTIVINP